MQSHPKYEEICRCTPDGATEARRQAFLVYMDLAESKGWYNVQVHGCPRDGRVVLSGHASRTSDRDYVVITDSNSSLSHADIQSAMHDIHEKYLADSVLLALIDTNSSIIYYRATNALCPPDCPEVVEAKHTRSRRLIERRKARTQMLRDSVRHIKNKLRDRVVHRTVDSKDSGETEVDKQEQS